MIPRSVFGLESSGTDSVNVAASVFLLAIQRDALIHADTNGCLRKRSQNLLLGLLDSWHTGWEHCWKSYEHSWEGRNVARTTFRRGSCWTLGIDTRSKSSTELENVESERSFVAKWELDDRLQTNDETFQIFLVAHTFSTIQNKIFIKHV